MQASVVLPDMQEHDAVVNLCSPLKPAEVQSQERAHSAQPDARPVKRRARRPVAAAPLIDLSAESSPVLAGPSVPGTAWPANDRTATDAPAVQAARAIMDAEQPGTSRKRRWGDMEDEAASAPTSASEQQRQREQQQRLRSRMVAELERQRQAQQQRQQQQAQQQQLQLQAHQQRHQQRQQQQQQQQASERRSMAEVTSAPAGAQSLQWGQTATRQQRMTGRPSTLPPQLQPMEAMQLLQPVPAPSRRAAASGPSARGRVADVDLDDDDALLARRMQEEEEDARLAAAMMAEEQDRARREGDRMQARFTLMQRLEEQVAAQEAEFMAALEDDQPPYAAYHNRRHGSSSSRRAAAAARPSHRLPAAGSAGSSSAAAAAAAAAAMAAAAAAGPSARDNAHRRGFGLAMASAMMAFPRWAGGGGPGGAGGGGGGRRGLMLPQGLRDMREAMMGMQRAGLPPQMLFSDRDFTADDYDMLCRLDDTVENRKGAAPEAIASLPTQVVPAGGLRGDNREKLSCAVCLEEWEEGAKVSSLPCTHRFCSGCINKWLQQKASCPICQRECKP